jgi:uncharacterized metal-binding protein (TIGR02443 family)
MTEGPANTPRRFIAGAVCPRCKEMDTVVMYRREGVERRECVSCDFFEEANFGPTGQELPTRVNRSAEPVPIDPHVRVVKILDPGKSD